MRFADRTDAGRRLAERVAHLRGGDVVVLGLPRGGVVVAAEVARALGAPLDVVVVRKLGVPFQPELAMGAIGEDGVRVLNEDVLRSARISGQELAEVEETETRELERRVRRYRGDRPRVPLTGRTALLVDDGIATGATAHAACDVVRALGARRVVVATPIAPPRAVAALRRSADDVVCVETPEWFDAIGAWYDDFAATPDDEVVRLLRASARTVDLTAAPTVDEDVTIPAGPVLLPGRLTVPGRAYGVVLFAHGSGSGSRSPRNRYVASVLNDAGLATLLFDLLTEAEARDRANVFDVELLARRLGTATAWWRARPGAPGLPVGYFGASTGAAAALRAAAEPGADIAAVVSRGGRPDLAGPRLGEVRAPALLVVGGRDETVLDLNREARTRLPGESRLVVVPGATHLFEEPGALEAAARLARDWFLEHLAAVRGLARR